MQNRAQFEPQTPLDTVHQWPTSCEFASDALRLLQHKPLYSRRCLRRAQICFTSTTSGKFFERKVDAVTFEKVFAQILQMVKQLQTSAYTVRVSV